MTKSCSPCRDYSRHMSISSSNSSSSSSSDPLDLLLSQTQGERSKVYTGHAIKSSAAGSTSRRFARKETEKEIVYNRSITVEPHHHRGEIRHVWSLCDVCSSALIILGRNSRSTATFASSSNGSSKHTLWALGCCVHQIESLSQ